MKGSNIGLSNLGAKIINFSSTSDEQHCHPSNVLVEKEDVPYISLSQSGLEDKDYHSLSLSV